VSVNRDAQLAFLVATLYEAVLRPAEWTRLLAGLAQVFNAAIVDFSHYNVEHHDQTISQSSGVDQAQITRYLEHFAARNPWVEAGPQQVPGRVVIGEQLIPQALFERSEYYNDFLRPMDVAHVMSVGIQGNERRFTALSVLRSKRRGPFDSHETAFLEHLLPHLKRAVQIHERVASVERGNHPLVAVADQINEGLILLDGAGRPLFVNRDASSILAGTDVVRLTRRGLRARRPVDDARLRELVCSAARQPRLGATGGGGMLSMPRGGGARPLVLLVTPGGAGASWLEGARQGVTIWLRDPDAIPSPPHEWLQHAFGLTPAEASLAALISEGHDPKGAAACLGLSVHTTRSQLKAVLGKTGTHSQAELVRLTRAAGPPTAPTPSG
jgi:DNA-binding CsgD family transcriptional regulator